MTKNIKIKKFFSIYVVCVMVWLGVLGVARANTLPEIRITSQEKAIFAFFRAANVPPDYEFWIKTSLDYEAVPESKREEYMVQEMLRLGHGYGQFDSDEDVLQLRVNVISKFIPATEDKPARIIFRFVDAGADQAYIPTFDYPYGSGIVSMIINRLAAFSNLTLSEEQAKILQSKLPYEGDDFDATLIIDVRVTRADFDNPIEKESTLQWVMVGDIAYIKCELDSYYTQQKDMLWDYLAPWYEDAYKIKNMPEEEKYPHPYDLFKK